MKYNKNNNQDLVGYPDVRSNVRGVRWTWLVINRSGKRGEPHWYTVSSISGGGKRGWIHRRHGRWPTWMAEVLYSFKERLVRWPF